MKAGIGLLTKKGERQKALNNLFALIFGLAGVSVIVIFVFMTYYIFASGVPAITQIGLIEFLTGTVWQPAANQFGILPMIIGSLCVTGGAVLIGFPIGVLMAIFLAEVAPSKVSAAIRPAVQLLAGIPSVVYGFFGLAVFVPRIAEIQGAGNSMLAAILILAIMILPTVITVSETALRAVPTSYKAASYALGETKTATIFRVTLPAAKSGVFASLVLGVGRALGEATAVILVAGNTVQIPDSIFDMVRTLTANCTLEMGYASGLHREALFGTAAVLFLMIMIVNLILYLLNRKGEKKA